MTTSSSEDPAFRSLPVLLKVGEVAELLRTSPKAIYVMAERGQIPVVRIGRRLLIPRSALAQWLADRCSVSPDGDQQ